MRNRVIYYFAIFMVAVIFIKLLPSSNGNSDVFSKRAKISLREIGNQLLLANKDSASLVLPIKRMDNLRFEISFQNKLFITPDSLVIIVKESLQADYFPQNYQVEVLRCSDAEVAYSYEINEDAEKTIIPCASRVLPSACYTVEIQFLQEVVRFDNRWSILILILLVFVVVEIYLRKRTIKKEQAKRTPKYTTLGSFRFYPEQNKLIKEAKEIALSKKECELLEIFVSNANQVLKRRPKFRHLCFQAA